jgi:hypothetical protein
MFWKSLVVPFLLAIVLSVLLRFTTSDYRLWYLRFTTSDYCLWYLRFTTSDYRLWYLRFTTSDYRLWYLRFTTYDYRLWYLQSFLGSFLINQVIKDKVLITVGCPIFPFILIAKYLFTGSLKNRSIDHLETQKKYISKKNSQFFNYLLYAKSK